MSMLATGSGKAAGPLSTQRPIRAIDLTARKEHRALWRSAAGIAVPPAELPGGGTPSSQGYWLAPLAEGTSAPPGAPSIRFFPYSTTPAPPPSSAPRRRPPLTVRVKPTHTGDGELILVIGPDFAHVHSSEAAWHAVAEPVLLAICQYWRFAAVDAELDRLTSLALDDLEHATMPGLKTFGARRRLEATARDVRTLLVDLPHFQGPLTDPLPYCSSERAAAAYTTIAEKLHLEAWCELIDERAEAVEDTYEALTEKLFEYKNFATEALLEVVIVVILLTELAINCYDVFSP